jgi:DNA-binding IclR family transcriptional regulator
MNMPGPCHDSYKSVQSIERGCRILECLSGRRGSYSIRDISARLDIPKPTVHRILSTFIRFGYVKQDSISKEYRLGFGLVELGQSVLGQIDLRKEAQPFLHDLADRVQETVHLVVLEDSEILYLDKVEKISDPRGLRMASRIGMRNYAHSCAVGKVLLAYLPEGKRKEVYAIKGLPRLTAHTIVDRERLERHLADVAERGYAVDDEENEAGIRCVAAPVRNDAGEVVAGISISGPAVRMSLERIEKTLRPDLLRTARETSKRIGYRRNS